MVDDALTATRGAAALVVAQVGTRLGAVIFALVAARTLAPDDFGRYSAIAALLGIAGVLADFGTSTETARRVAAVPDRVSSELAIAIPTSFALGVVVMMLGIPYVIISDLAPVPVWAALAGLAGLPFLAASGTYGGALTGVGRMQARALVVVLGSSVTLLGGALALALDFGVAAAVVCLGLGPVASWASSRLLVGGSSPAPEPLALRGATTLLRASAPLAVLASISVVASRLDILVVAGYSGSSEAANYDIAVRIIESAAVISTSVSGPLVYLVARRLHLGNTTSAQRALDICFGSVVAVGACISAVLVSFGDRLIVALFGDEYSSGGDAVRILGGQLWLSFGIGVLGATLVAAARARAAIPVALGVTSVTVMLDFVLIPIAGAIGAAVATVIAAVVGAVAFSVALSRLTPLRLPRLHLAVPACAAVAAGSGVLMRGASVVVGAVVVICIYAVPVAALRATPLASILQLFRHRREATP